MYTIRASSLGTFNVSPAKFKYWKFTGDQLVTWLWDIMHYYARDKDWGRLLLDFYTRNLKKDLKIDNIIKKLFLHLDWVQADIDERAIRQYDEMPMMLQVLPNLIVTGSSDKIVEFKDDEYVHIFDWKTCASLDWYEDKYRKLDKNPDSRIRDENLQWLFYWLAAMEYLWYAKAKFHFVWLEKKPTAKIRLFTKEFTRDEGWKLLRSVWERYVTCNELDMRWHWRSRYCFFPGGCCDRCPNNEANKKDNTF